MVFNQVIFCICFSQNERPLASNCNPMFATFRKTSNWKVPKPHVLVSNVFYVNGPSQGLTLLVIRNTDKYIWCQNCNTFIQCPI